jgi:type IV secretion system protein VirB1
MMLSIAAAAALAHQCAPSVAPETLLSVAHAESELDPLAIGVNRGPKAPRVANAQQAAQVARDLIAKGYNIDLGIAQINSRNLQWLGLTVDDAFDPCRNFAAAARVLQTNYQATVRAGAADPLGQALSRYNTGRDERGFANGYVGRVYRAAQTVVPALQAADGTPRQPFAIPDQPPASRDTPTEPAAASWDVFARPNPSSVLVFGGNE